MTILERQARPERASAPANQTSAVLTGAKIALMRTSTLLIFDAYNDHD